MERRTPFGMAGQSSFQQFQPPDPQMMQSQLYNMNQFNNQAFGYNQQVMNGQESKIRSLMSDYESVRGDLNQLQLQGTPNKQNTSRRPYSRELDLMNLLLVGSMDNKQSRSGLEGMGGLLGPNYTNTFEPQQQQQYSNQMQSYYMPQQYQDPSYNQNQAQQQSYQSQQYIPQQYAASTPSYQNSSQSQQGNRQNRQLLVNGQIGVNVDTYNQMPEQNMGSGSQPDRIASHIEKQNMILEQLTQNLMKQRETKGNQDKIELQSRIRELETLNTQGRGVDETEFPQPYQQTQRFNSQPPINQPPPYMYPFGQPYGQPQGYGQPYSYGFNQNQLARQPAPQQTKQEKIQMMMLLKKLKEDLRRKKKRAGRSKQEVINDGKDFSDQQDEDSDEEELSVEIIVKPREMRARPLPIPEYYDPQPDMDRLKKLKSQRGMINLRLFFFSFAYIVLNKKQMKDNIIKKKTATLAEMNQFIPQFVEGTEQWITRVCKNALQETVTNTKMNLQIVPINGKAISDKDKIKNGASLMLIVKQIIDNVVDNSSEQDISEEMVFLLGRFTHDREFLPNAYFSKFEINRLNFTYHGALDLMTLPKQQMVICMNIWIRIIIYRIFSQPWALFQGAKVTDQIKINVKTICSVLYEIVMLFLRGQTAIQPNNQKHIPVEYQVKERKDTYLKIESFEPTQDEITKFQAKLRTGSDEPVLFPLYDSNDMALLYFLLQEQSFQLNRLWVNNMVALIEGWSEAINSITKNYQHEQKQDYLQDLQEAQAENIKTYKVKQTQVLLCKKKRQETYRQLTLDIASLEERIVTESKKAEQQKSDYEEKKLQKENFNLRQKINPQVQTQQNIPNVSTQMRPQLSRKIQ